jgi:Zn2+/Cd2+-exporting ATPase
MNSSDTLAFKIRGMDCAEEVAVLKRELGPLVGDEARLGFDLINGKLTIGPGDTAPDADALQAAVARTGMRALPWDEHLASRDDGEGSWSRHGRAVLCAASGTAIAAGLSSHAWSRGLAEALRGHAEGAAQFPWVSTLFYAAAIVTGAWYVAPKAWYALRRLRPDMNLLMTVAVIGAVILGEWLEAGTVAFLFALALLLESWSVGRARHAISALLDLSPAVARAYCPHDKRYEEKPVAEVNPGTRVQVRPGERIPLDGAVIEGMTTVDQAPITGESVPVDKAPDDEVYAGTINNEGAFVFEVTHAADDTTLARIIHMVEDAQTRRAPSEQWVERFARVYTPAMMLLALLVAVLPPLVMGGAWTAWFYQALVILVIACPCALVISTPVSIVAGLACAARHGVLIKGGAYLEAPARLRAIALDKTGTLTKGRPEVQRIIPLNDHTEHELLARAAALEAHSEHPLARAVLHAAEERGVAYTPADGFQALRGRGAEARVDGRLFWIGSHRMVHERGAESDEAHEQALALEDAGHSVVMVGNDDHICGLISVADALRPDAKAAVTDLRAAGLKPIVMLTGDNAGTAEAVAAMVGVDEFRAEILPEDKAAAIEALHAQYGPVAMVGEGVNDAPAMAVATLGIAMGAAGTDAAIETADVALMSDDLSRLPWLLRHARRTLRVIQANIAFALGLKVIFVALALAGLATLWMAIAADMGASLLVIANGLRLLRSP